MMNEQTVINAIATALAPTGATVYVTELKQNINDGDILIQSLQPGYTPMLTDRYQAAYPFDIIYINEDREKALAMADTLFDLLEEFDTADGRIRGHGFAWHYTDGALHFLVTYRAILQRPQDTAPMMKKLTINGGVSNG